jgi:hypothetical protein
VRVASLYTPKYSTHKSAVPLNQLVTLCQKKNDVQCHTMCIQHGEARNFRSSCHCSPSDMWSHWPRGHGVLCGAGCQFPLGQAGEVYECKHHHVCHDSGVTIYGWGKDAPDLTLGNETGIMIGDGSGFEKLVLQVCPHFGFIFSDFVGHGMVLFSKQFCRCGNITRCHA